MDRRQLLAGVGLMGVAGPSAFARADAQAPAATAAPQPPAPTSAEIARRARISEAAAGNRKRLDFDGNRFSGPGWDELVERGSEAQFFMLGEEHGIAENPKLAAQLFTALVPTGYSKVAVEISHPMAAELDRALAEGGPQALNRMLLDPPSRVAFFGMQEEAEWLASARRAVPRGPFLWGLDYEVGADRHLISILEGKRKPESARVALASLKAASTQSWARYEETRGPQHIYSFAGDPQLVRAVRAAWPTADAQSAHILDTLEETFAINQLWGQGRGWESNARRAALLRGNFLRQYRAEKRAGRAPKVFLKFGASHLMRGRNSTETYDIGSLLPEVAAMEGNSSFSLFVLPGAGRRIAAFDPAQFRHPPGGVPASSPRGLEPIVSQSLPEGMTLFDTRPLRPLLAASRPPADADLMRVVHSYDAILVMTGSTPSSQLQA